MPVTHLMSAQVSPLALIIPRPQIPSAIPRLSTSSFISSAPRTPSRSPVASHIFISPPAPNRTSTDSWNSSNYDFDDPSVQWKEDEVRLLGRTLDALPAHLITPFNGSIPPPNLLDKISRGITAAKGPNDWPHSVTATRAKLLELARARAQEERRRSIIDEDFIFLGNGCHATMPGELHKRAECKDGTPDPADVLQPTTNTPARRRQTLHRQSSMDFMADANGDQKESISRLSHRLQRHEHATFHHPYMRPTHLRRTTEHSLPPSTPSSSTLNTARQSRIRKSTASSSSNSTFGSPVPVPLRPSSLRRSSTLTLASSCDMSMNSGSENVSKTLEIRRSGGYEESAAVGVKVKSIPARDSKASATSTRTPLARKVKTPIDAKVKTQLPALSVSSPPKSLRSKIPVLPTTTVKEVASTKQPKFRKGHVPSLSVSSDEEENARSKRAKKLRTREPSLSRIAPPDARQPLLASSQITGPVPKVKAREPNQSRISAASGSKTSSSSSDNDNEFSTSSVETAATSVSLSTPAALKRKPSVQAQKEEPKPIPVRRNLARNSMFGPELPCPQATPSPPSRIPLSSPIYTASPSPPSPSSPSTPPLSRPRTLRRAARRIEFGTLVNARAASPGQSGEGSTLVLGSAFQLA